MTEDLKFLKQLKIVEKVIKKSKGYYNVYFSSLFCGDLTYKIGFVTETSCPENGTFRSAGYFPISHLLSYQETRVSPKSHFLGSIGSLGLNGDTSMRKCISF